MTAPVPSNEPQAVRHSPANVAATTRGWRRSCHVWFACAEDANTAHHTLHTVFASPSPNINTRPTRATSTVQSARNLVPPLLTARLLLFLAPANALTCR